MANQIEKLNTIAPADIEKVNTLTDAQIEKINTLEFAGISYTVATGGTITTDGDFKVHVFNSSGTFEVTTLGTDTSVTYLLVAGGAGGGGFAQAAGGREVIAGITQALVAAALLLMAAWVERQIKVWAGQVQRRR